MPVYLVDSETFALKSAHRASPCLILLSEETRWPAIPEPLRRAVDVVWLGHSLETSRISSRWGGAAWLYWRRGERWRQGRADNLRFTLAIPGRRYFVPVHYESHHQAEAPLTVPGFEGLKLPSVELIGLEPRWFSAPEANAGRPERQDSMGWQDSIDWGVRLCTDPSAGAAEPFPHGGGDPEPWEQLRAALIRESLVPGSAVPELAQLAQQQAWHPVLRSLCLRNLIVALMLCRETDAAGKLLRQARDLYPGYRELAYLAAVQELTTGRVSEAVAALRAATEPDPRAGSGAATAAPFLGSGGEAGYRAHYVLALLAERMGRQQVAVTHFLSGVRQTPAFAPSVAGLLRQRMTPGMLGGARWLLRRLARREPQYQDAVFHFFLLHRSWADAERLLGGEGTEPPPHADRQRRWRALAALRTSVPRPPGAAAGVVLQGPFQIHASVALVNRHVAAAIEADGRFELALDPSIAGTEPLAAFPDSRSWSAGLTRLPRRLDLTLRHFWPPDFSLPPAGKLALILPWEFGAIPRHWLDGLARVDRVLTPSNFVRDVLVRAGANFGRIRVIPNGIDTGLFQPGKAWRPEQARKVEFLFVGGAIRRKGMDLLLRAWREAFTAADDVTLVIKGLGGSSFYRHLSLNAEIAALQADTAAAPVIYLEDEWSETRMPELYRGCDALALPYRGEGFGLPLAEALACGKPVIATAAGPAPEFCPAGASWLLPAREVPVPEDLRPPGEMSGTMTWFEPSLEALIAALRETARLASSGELARRGARAAEAMRHRYGWDVIGARYREEIADLTEARS